jgi:hypothetical protein
MSVVHRAVRVERNREAMRAWIAEDPERAKAYIEERVQMVPWSGCWLWERALTGHGYGNAVRAVGNRRWWFAAHSLSYEAFVGPVPGRMMVRHRCDVPACCNPDHLEVGTVADNHMDMVERGRSLRGARNHMSKLSESDVKCIVKMRAQGMIYRDIGERFGVSARAVGNVIRGDRWAHVTGIVS